MVGIHRNVNSWPKQIVLDVLGRKPKPKMLCNNAMYFRCNHNYMIEENDKYKVMFYFLSPNVIIFFK